MTFDTRPVKSPARTKSQDNQPVMTQKSLLSFFKSNAPVNDATIPKREPSFDTPEPLMLTPVKNKKSDNSKGTNSVNPSLLFSTDEVLVKSSGSKRKTIDFEEEEEEGTSPISRNETTRSVKKFAAEVEKLSLSTPVKKLQLDNPDDEDQPSSSRRP
ncbi:hypothetical protein BGZ49_002977, partial [Haplosporangium sp. Z 27]